MTSSSMDPPPHFGSASIRQISKEQTLLGERSNPFWLRFGTRIRQALLYSTVGAVSVLDKIYVTDRSTKEDSDELLNLREKLRDQVGAEVESLGTAELDLLDFLLNMSDHRVLSLIGLRGVGKSTLVQYVTMKLRHRIPALRDLLPIHIDLLGWRTAPRDMSISRSLAQQAIYALSNLLHDATGSDSDLARCLTSLVAVLDIASLNHLSDLLQILRVHCPSHSPLLIFDNTDHLHPDDLATVIEEARVLWMTHRATTILATRPSTYRTQIETGNNKSVFIQWAISVNPPSLKAVVKRRLEWSKKHRTTPLSGTIKTDSRDVTIDDAEAMISNVVEDVLTNDEIRTSIEALTNRDMRASLLMLERILSSRSLGTFVRRPLPSAIFIDPDDESRYSALDALLLSNRIVFASDATNSGGIANLFGSLTVEGHPSYVLQFYFLAVLARSDAYLSWRTVVETLSPLGWTKETLIRCRNCLIQLGLVYSPEAETQVDATRWNVENLRLSEAGRFYYQTLVARPDYIYQVAYDTRLPHARWPGPQRGLRYPFRIWSVYELLCGVLHEEEFRIERVLQRPSMAPELIAALRERGLLSAIILGAARSKLETGAKSSRAEAKREAGSVADQIQKDGIDGRVAALISQLGGLDTRHEVKEDFQVFRRRIGCGMQVEVTLPRRLHAGFADEMSLTLQKGNDSVRSQHLVAIVGIQGDVQPRDPVLHLAWDGRTARGSTRLLSDNPGCSLRSAFVQILDGIQPLGDLQLKLEDHS